MDGHIYRYRGIFDYFYQIGRKNSVFLENNTLCKPRYPYDNPFTVCIALFHSFFDKYVMKIHDLYTNKYFNAIF